MPLTARPHLISLNLNLNVHTSRTQKAPSIPIYHSCSLSISLSSVIPTSSASSKASAAAGGLVIKSSLIDRDGSSLVELVVPVAERESRRLEAAKLPMAKLSTIDMQWVHVISEGWASPLRGFMREHEYLQSLHFNSLRLEDGSVVNMSLPIVLDIDDWEKEAIEENQEMRMREERGEKNKNLSLRASFISMKGKKGLQRHEVIYNVE